VGSGAEEAKLEVRPPDCLSSFVVLCLLFRRSLLPVVHSQRRTKLVAKTAEHAKRINARGITRPKRRNSKKSSNYGGNGK